LHPVCPGIGFAGEKCAFVTSRLGQMLGSEMYDVEWIKREDVLSILAEEEARDA